MLTDIAVSTIGVATVVLFVGWLAVLLFGYAVWLLLRRRDFRTAMIMAAGAGAALIALIFRTTGLGGTAAIALNNSRLVSEGAPYYIALLAAGLFCCLVIRLSRARAWVGLILVLVPIVIVLSTRAPGGSGTVAAPIVGIASSPPSVPLEDPRYPGMVYVPSGPFIRGSLNPHQMDPPVGRPEGDEHPVRSIFLDGYFIDRQEVSNADFRRFVAATGFVTDAERLGSGIVRDAQGFRYMDGANWRNPFGEPGAPEPPADHPVVQLSWYDAAAYCEFVGKELPTEAQWEKAARGVDGRTYPWGNDFDPARANYCDADCSARADNPAVLADGFPRTAPVDSASGGASPYGALNMAGNVWEWVSDWYDPSYYEYAPGANPQGAIRSQSYQVRKVVRGGSWASFPEELSTTNRSYDDPVGWRSFGVGARCAVNETAPALEPGAAAARLE